jgi:hypothetical protein
MIHQSRKVYQRLCATQASPAECILVEAALVLYLDLPASPTAKSQAHE